MLWWTVAAFVVVWLFVRAGRPRATVAPSSRPGYQEHLRSPYWRKMKRLVRQRAGNRCEHFMCWRRRNLSVHHEHYDTFGHESLNDLKLYCPKHHRRADARRRARERRGW